MSKLAIVPVLMLGIMCIALDPAKSARVKLSNACDVVREQDAKAIFGSRVHRVFPVFDTGIEPDRCDYGYSDQKVVVTVMNIPFGIQKLKQAEEREGLKFEPVKSVGDKAFYSPAYGLLVDKGRRSILYKVDAGIGDAKQRSIRLAKRTISRL